MYAVQVRNGLKYFGEKLDRKVALDGINIAVGSGKMLVGETIMVQLRI